jgi:hypothetical protein
MFDIKNKIKSLIYKLKGTRELDNQKIQIARKFFFNLKLNLKNINDIEQVFYKVSHIQRRSFTITMYNL